MSEETDIESMKATIAELEAKLAEKEVEPEPKKKPRTSTGRFTKKTTKPKKEENEEEIIEEEPSENDDMLLEEIAQDLKKELGLSDEVYKTYDEFTVRQKVQMMRTIIKTQSAETDNTGRGEAKTGASAPAPKDTKIPTLLEKNNSKLYFNDLRGKTSYLKLGERFRGRNEKK